MSSSDSFVGPTYEVHTGGESVWHCQGCGCGGGVEFQWGVRLADEPVIGPMHEAAARQELAYYRVRERTFGFRCESHLVKRSATVSPWEEVVGNA